MEDQENLPDNVIQFPMHRVRKSVINPTPVMPPVPVPVPVAKKKKIKEKKTETPVIDQKDNDAMLQIEMPDGSVWELRTSVIATVRADEAADNADKTVHEEDVYFDVYAETLANDDLLISWAEKNVKWENIVKHARMIKSPLDNDYAAGWLEGMKRIVKT